MRLVGRRQDGAEFIALGGGLAVMMRGGRVTPPVAEEVIHGLGPWVPVAERPTQHALQKSLDAARTTPVEAFALAMSFDERRDRVLAAIRRRMGLPSSYGYSPMPYGAPDPYIPSNGFGEDWVVYSMPGPKHLMLKYSVSEDGSVQFDGDPVEVRQAWEEVSAGLVPGGEMSFADAHRVLFPEAT